MNRIKLTQNDIRMLENLLYFDTMPDEYIERIEKLIKHSKGET